MNKTNQIELIKKKIINDPERLDRAVGAQAKQLYQNKLYKSFYDAVYTQMYDYDTLSRKPFLNIGPGSFFHDRWKVADKYYTSNKLLWNNIRRQSDQIIPDYIWDICELVPFPENDKYFKIIYCSHVIEHLFDHQLQHLFSEIFRILDHGGSIRIACPDASLLATMYEQEDWFFFFNYLHAKTGRRKLIDFDALSLKAVCASFLIEWTSLLSNKKNPVFISPLESIDYLSSFDSIYDAFEDAKNKSSIKLNMELGAHVNWFTKDRLAGYLRSAGFKVVKHSQYLQSCSPILRDSQYFDKTDPEMSLYLDAFKM